MPRGVWSKANVDEQPGLFAAPLTHKLHDVGRWTAGHEASDIVEVDPATLCDFVVRTSFGAIRDFAGEHVMVLLLSTEVEEVFGRLPGKSRFFLEFAKSGDGTLFPLLEDPAWQGPLRLTTCDQKNSFASTADHGCAFLQTGLPLAFQTFSRALDAPAYRLALCVAQYPSTEMRARRNVNAGCGHMCDMSRQFFINTSH